VGDESFQKKSGKALQDIITGGVTTVYVSHSMDAIRKTCNRAIWLEQGEIRAEGEAETIALSEEIGADLVLVDDY